MKLSIIIPVYQVENTIKKCVDSILCQNYKDMEIILVDDGSIDKSVEICDTYAAIDYRVRVIHKPNGGLSDARNAGLGIATGDYITFVDSDDYVNEGTFNKLMNITFKHPEYDIIEYSVIFRRGKTEKKMIFPEKVFDNSTDYWNKGEAYEHSYAWNKIYKRDLFDDVRYPKGKVFEDIWTLPLLTSKARYIAMTSVLGYNYNWNPKGITATANGNDMKMLLDAHINLMKNESLSMSQNMKYYMGVVNIQLLVYELTGEEPILPYIKINNFTSLDFKYRVKAFALNTLGLKTMCKLNKSIHILTKCH